MPKPSHNATGNRSGTFRGSEASGAKVSVYGHADEPGMPEARKHALHFDSRVPGVSDDHFRLIACETRKRVDGSAGTFTFAVKSRDPNVDLRDLIVDDDWVDISFTRHDRSFHVMRGLVDVVAPAISASGTGATETVYVVSGRDFTKIFELTPVWFDRITDGDYAGAALTRIMEETEGVFGNVAKVVSNVLGGFLQEFDKLGRATWVLPPSMPGGQATLQVTQFGKPFLNKTLLKPPPTTFQLQIPQTAAIQTPAVSIPTGGRNFLNDLVYFTEHWMNDPPRASSLNPVYFDPQNTYLWPLAQHYSDPALCELYCDLVSADSPNTVAYFHDDQASTPDTTKMALILRDRPFLTAARHEVGANVNEPDPKKPEALSSGPWFNRIPMYTVDRGDCVAIQTARSGAERKNMFMAAPAIFQESLKAWPELQTPLISVNDVSRHGVRRMDVITNYATSSTDVDLGGSPLGLALNYRERIRDFHCMNHLFYSGNVPLAIGRPDIRVGGRLRIRGDDPERDETYYIEEVRNAWQAPESLSRAGGLNTTIGVTRGWRGTDRSLTKTFTTVRDEYNDAAIQKELRDHQDAIKARGEDS